MEGLKIKETIIHTVFYEKSDDTYMVKIDLRKEDGDWIEHVSYIKNEKIIKQKNYYPTLDVELKVNKLVKERYEIRFQDELKTMQKLIKTPLEDIVIDKVKEDENSARIVFYQKEEKQKYEILILKRSGKKVIRRHGISYLDFGYGYGKELMNHVLKKSSFRIRAMVNGYLEGCN